MRILLSSVVVFCFVGHFFGVNAAPVDFDTHVIIESNADCPSSVYAADMDGDGDLDVLSASSGDNKIAYINSF